MKTKLSVCFNLLFYVLALPLTLTLTLALALTLTLALPASAANHKANPKLATGAGPAARLPTAAEARVSKTEYEIYLKDSKEFAASEKALRKAYENGLDTIGPNGEMWLRMRQADWAKEREIMVLAECGPKGSEAYLAAMAKAGNERVDWFKALAEKGKAIFVVDYAYSEPDFEGVLTMFRRKDESLDFVISTTNLKNNSQCEIEGIAPFANGRAVFNGEFGQIGLDVMELGHWVRIISNAEQGICNSGGRFTGRYDRAR